MTQTKETKKTNKETKFTKSQLYNSEMFLEDKDLVIALLDEDKTYTKKEVNDIFKGYLNKEVK